MMKAERIQRYARWCASGTTLGQMLGVRAAHDGKIGPIYIDGTVDEPRQFVESQPKLAGNG